MSAAEPSAAARGLAPGPPLRGTLRPPGSKSLAIRALLCAGLGAGRARLAGLPDGEDAHAALDVLAACGVELRRPTPATAVVAGRPPGPERGPSPEEPVQVGESGTLARLATAALAFCAPAGAPVEVRVRGSLARRASPALLAALRAGGVELSGQGAARGGWPLVLRPIGPPSELRLVRPSSSQEASALLLALAAWPGEHLLVVEGPIPSRPYLDMTVALLLRFGARVHVRVVGREERFLVQGPLRAPDEPVLVEADASAAAVALAAACISGGGVTVSGVGAESLQGDARIVEHLAAFGCEADARAGELYAAGAPRHGAELDLTGEPDLAPVLAAVAGVVALRARRGELEGDGASRLTGLGTLEGKESPRVTVLAEGLEALGLAVERGDDVLAVAPGAGAPTDAPLLLDPRGDHRMAFAFALLGLAREDVLVRDPGCVAKSWPRFWEDLERLGARVEERP